MSAWKQTGPEKTRHIGFAEYRKLGGYKLKGVTSDDFRANKAPSYGRNDQPNWSEDYDRTIRGVMGSFAPLTDPALLEKTDSMSKLIDSTVQTVRKIATGLRPEMLDDMGLVAAVGWQAKDFQKRTGIRCRAKLPPETTANWGKPESRSALTGVLTLTARSTYCETCTSWSWPGRRAAPREQPGLVIARLPRREDGQADLALPARTP